MTPTGYATHLRSGDKTFSRTKIDKTYQFLKPNIHPPRQTRRKAPRRKVSTGPPGDCKVTGNKERPSILKRKPL